MGNKNVSAYVIIAVAVTLLLASAVAIHSHGSISPQAKMLEFSSGTVGTASIHAPAVILSNNSGVITIINLTITKGDGNVSIVGPRSVGSSTLQAAQNAAAFASSYTGRIESDYNFTYAINDYNASVSGPSAGAAMTVLALSAFSNKPLLSGFTMTGTINPNGSIGPIGGVYDKMSAASAEGFKFGLVPYAAPGSFENELYLLIQTNFHIPIIEVSNVSQAFAYATGSAPIAGHNVTFSFYTTYNVSALPDAPLTCSNSCNESNFRGLMNYTENITGSMVSTLSNGRFSDIAANLSNALVQSEQIGAKGYYYAAADFAFLDYANAYLMHSASTTKQQGIQTLVQTSSSCASIQPPQITSANYEYVLGGELRQAWGNYTAESLIANYNSTATDSDGVMENMYENGISQAWCSSAAYMYGVAQEIGGNASEPSASLASLAASRISSAGNYGNSYYYQTALAAYKNHNYPLAILDADYAFATGSASKSFSMNTSALDAMAESTANSSTDGIWATQYANEAMFYVYESRITTNSSAAHSYAASAYSSAVLASAISNDTKAIASSLIPVTTSQTPQDLGALGSQLSSMYGLLETIAILILAILIIVAIILGFVLMLVYHVSKAGSGAMRSGIAHNEVARKRARRSARR
jgi:uncharacterized protein